MASPVKLKPYGFDNLNGYGRNAFSPVLYTADGLPGSAVFVSSSVGTTVKFAVEAARDKVIADFIAAFPNAEQEKLVPLIIDSFIGESKTVPLNFEVAFIWTPSVANIAGQGV